MAYKVGDLELNIQAISNSTINSLDEVIKRLNIVNSLIKSTSKNTISGAISNQSKSPSSKTKSITEKALSFGIIAAKLRMSLYFAKRLGNAIGIISQYGSDYTETLNKWQVAMRYNIADADIFIKKMRTAYGISTQMLMDTQSTFKNLLSGLGNISEATSYKLSESITLMMLDFASLYNQTIERASSKFQAMIAGQIRPVRSVSGIDVSETSIYDLYTRLGGTKTMRQLNQMEKRLLRIYATFEQMQSAGATGDFSKTIEQWANQSRLMTENYKELVTWIGIGVKELLESAGVLTYINAALLTATEVIKALIYASGYKDENFLEGMNQSAEATNDAIDELQGKLLDFDKIRALNTNQTGGILAIDQTVLDALSSYNSQLDNAKYKAQELSEMWLQALGFTKDENGELTITDKNLSRISSSLKAIGIIIGVLISYALVTKLISLVKWLFNLHNVLQLVNFALIAGLIYTITKFVEAVKNGDTATIIWSATLTGILLTALILVNKQILITFWQTLGKGLIILLTNATVATGSFGLAIWSVSAAFVALGASLVLAIGLFSKWDILTNGQKIIGVIGLITTAVLGLAMAFGVFHSAWSLGLATAGIVAGIIAVSAAIGTAKSQAKQEVEYHALGASDIDGGTLFVAGESGKTEAVYSGANGKSNVANISQLKTAFYQALVDYGKTQSDNGTITINLDGERIYQNTTNHAKRYGKKWSNV